MALKDLTTPTFLSLFDAWLDPERELPRIQKLPHARALLIDIEQARDALRGTHAVDDSAPPALVKLQERAATLDGKHDRKARGLDKVLDGLSELTDDSDLAEGLQTARGEVLGPKGLSVITSSYGDEAQNAKLADQRLSKESKKVLADVEVLNQSLAKWLKDWQAVAKKLGETDAEKTALEASHKLKPRRADAARARNQSIRVISAFTSMISLDGPDEATLSAIVGPLDATLAKAAKRARSSTPVEDTAPEDAAANDAPPGTGETPAGRAP